MSYSLAEAAQATGLNRSTILRAIKRGAISGVRDEAGAWSVEPVELHRVFPPAAATPKATPQDAQADALVAELRAQLSEMRAQRDAWQRVAERLALGAPKPSEPDAIAMPAPSNAQPAEATEQPSRFRRAWRWMRATGCLAGAGLLLVLATGAAGAQQQQPQQQQPPGCFTVEMSHSTQGNPQGSILLDRCTGKTWLLLCIRNDTAGCAFRWAPIPDATEPAGGP